MISKKVEKALIEQIKIEEDSSRIYMSMASWCESNGYPGAAHFLYIHSDEERMHMTKLIHFVNDRGGHALLSDLAHPVSKYDSPLDVFQKSLKHEEFVTAQINKLFELATEERDYTTGQFLQWYITEQIEEEKLVHTVLDKMNLAGAEKSGIFLIDKELEALVAAKTATSNQA
ncbi:MAG: ferritin [Bacteroidetes bacterium]|nr:ferritin [Bacteroidota bacterium]